MGRFKAIEAHEASKAREAFHMAITAGAKKAFRASLKKRVFNIRRKKDMDDGVKTIEQLIATKKIKEAVALMPKTYKAIDKAAKGHTIKKGAADRKKSRLMALLNKSAK